MSKMRVKDIKRDEVEVAVADATGQLRDLAARNQKLLTIVVVALAGIALAIAGTKWWIHREALLAQGAYAAAARMADTVGNTAPDPGGAAPKASSWAEVATAYEAVASQHPGTSAGRLALFQAGVAHLRAGDEPASVKALTAFVGEEPKHWATPHALQLLATAHEQAGDLAAAEAALKRVQDGDWPSFPPGVAVQRLAEFYDRTDRAEEAQPLWKMLAEDARFVDTSAQAMGKIKVAVPPARRVPQAMLPQQP